MKDIIILFFHPIVWTYFFRLYMYQDTIVIIIRWSDKCAYLYYICCSQLVYQHCMVVKKYVFVRTVEKSDLLRRESYRYCSYFFFNFDEIQYWVIVLYHLPRVSSFFKLELCSSIAITSSGLKNKNFMMIHVVK